MQMTPEACAAAEELTTRCETCFALISLHAPENDQLAATVEALLLEAEHAGRCPRVVIWRLRQRLAMLLCPLRHQVPVRKAAYA